MPLGEKGEHRPREKCKHNPFLGIENIRSDRMGQNDVRRKRLFRVGTIRAVGFRGVNSSCGNVTRRRYISRRGRGTSRVSPTSGEGLFRSKNWKRRSQARDTKIHERFQKGVRPLSHRDGHNNMWFRIHFWRRTLVIIKLMSVGARKLVIHPKVMEETRFHKLVLMNEPSFNVSEEQRSAGRVGTERRMPLKFQMRNKIRSKIVGTIFTRAAPQRMRSRTGRPVKDIRKGLQIGWRAVNIVMKTGNIDANHRRLAFKMKFVSMFLIAGPFPGVKDREIEAQNNKNASSASRIPRRAYSKATGGTRIIRIPRVLPTLPT